MKYTGILIIVVIVAVVLIVVALENRRIAKDSEVDENLSYHLYSTSKRNEYLKFLEEFDESKFEIVNITTVAESTNLYGGAASYMVTYKNK